MGCSAVRGWLRRQRDSLILGLCWESQARVDLSIPIMPCPGCPAFSRQKTFGIGSTGDAPRSPLASGGS